MVLFLISLNLEIKMNDFENYLDYTYYSRFIYHY